MKKNSFVEGTVIATLSVVFIKILGLLYVIPFYAIIGSQGGALYGYAYNIYTIFLSVSTTGVPIAISKIISEYNTLGYNEAKIRAFKLGRKIVSVISIVSFLLLITFAPTIAKIIIGNLKGGNTIDDVAAVIRIISFSILVVPLLSITRGYLQGHKYISPSSNSQIIEQIVRIFVIIFGSYLSYKVFHQSLRFTVSVAVTGAFFGALAGVIYLLYKIYKNRVKLGFVNDTPKDNISNKDIIKKIIRYTIPYIVLGLGSQIYTFLDMLLMLRTLGTLGYSSTEVEFITSAITTWGMKINMIINSLAIGLTTSLIPNIVQSFVSKDWNDVNAKINKTFEMTLLIGLPLAFGISCLSVPIWTVFYGSSLMGGSILSYSIFTALFSTLYLIIISILQGLNKFKISYLSEFSGFIAILLLDVPLMILFHKLNLPAYFGSISATIVGYSIAIISSLIALKKNQYISYQKAIQMLSKIIIPLGVMIISLIIMNNFISYDSTSKTSSLITIIIKASIAGSLYLIIALKMNLFQEIFGRSSINKIIRKLSFNLINLEDK